ncbi:hypothetical protein [Kitasatospora acidiphila]|uniref:hypothetical protein n=1 Tax=Kitasatospora acidiphila TaxID=2567942 RepID=UPI001C66A10B|nr:hypothetical protein [Kitasatospora acidiphila]
MWNFVFFMEGLAPAGSPRLVLPLLAHAETYWALRKSGRARDADHRQWQVSESVGRRTERPGASGSGSRFRSRPPRWT